MAEPPSSPPGAFASAEESASWYKRQYEQLCDELSEFRESSHELEAELEKDLDSADKRQRALEQKVETLKFEVDEWKEKCRKAKVESNTAQNTLEKEITTLRDNNRSLILKLRDIEVANDDIERQARNTTSSLEDLEHKYNVAIERTVMLEEEIKIGEQERETLRIEAQRYREELSDLKIEAEIMQDKIKKAEKRHLSTISTDISIPDSDTFDESPPSTASSPLISTPPNELTIVPTSKLPSNEPPSPPMSDASASLPRPPSKLLKTPMPSQKDSRLSSSQRSITPKPTTLAPLTIRQPTMSSISVARTPAPPRSTSRATTHKGPPSASLTHVRSLTAQMQRLEARVQSARSKLPAPSLTPPRFSPRASASSIPSTTSTRPRKLTLTSIGSSVVEETSAQSTDVERTGKYVSRLSVSGVPRLSYAPPPFRSSTNGTEGSSTLSVSRPSSRSSVSTYGKPDRPPSRNEIVRPRTSMSGIRAPMTLRSRSSMGGSLHSHSQSQGQLKFPELEEQPTPSRRVSRGAYGVNGTNGRSGSGSSSSIGGGGGLGTGIPTPGSLMARRKSSVHNPFNNRRISVNVSNNEERVKKLNSDLGETY